MTKYTDPARELAELCSSITQGNAARGDQWLAQLFEVAPWSKDFYQILFCIVDRTEQLIAIIGELEMDEDIRTEAVQHIKQVQSAFDQDALANQWNSVGVQRITPNVQPIRMLSHQVRQRVAYPKLAQEEVDELLSQLDQLLEWLQEHQTKENDFIRQALIDGLMQFRFRLSKVRWLGWGYTLESLREVIGAYMALERGLPAEGADPVAEAILKKVGTWTKDLYHKVGVVKGLVDTGDFMLRFYGAAALIAHGAPIAGLITGPAG